MPTTKRKGEKMDERKKRAIAKAYSEVDAARFHLTTAGDLLDLIKSLIDSEKNNSEAENYLIEALTNIKSIEEQISDTLTFINEAVHCDN
jgi:hypothetical protein